MIDDARGGSGREAEREIDEKLARSRIGKDVDVAIEDASPDERFRVIIEFNTDFPGGASAARSILLRELIKTEAVSPLWQPFEAMTGALDGELFGEPPVIAKEDVELFNSLLTETYLFATLTRRAILALAWLKARTPRMKGARPLIYKVWMDQDLTPQVYVSARTITVDAARRTFDCTGAGIVWAVCDTGIKKDHPHFKLHDTLDLPEGVWHHDFTAGRIGEASVEAALTDGVGHGTHVAGIIAGATQIKKGGVKAIAIHRNVRENEPADPSESSPSCISGIAPLCKLVSLKVLNDENEGQVSRVIAALNYIRLVNGSSDRLKIHGVNLSLGYFFDIKIYGAGSSPLCNEVNRLVASGVVVVVSAGNGGHGSVDLITGASGEATFLGTITDPGNAEDAITVGSTHRDGPEQFGVSYFSAKGPTADGRDKPDLVAPGERIISCSIAAPSGAGTAMFEERSGTSMAAPHVSGAIAAFLSVRRDYQRKPGKVKERFKQNAASLHRRPEFQGAGLVDLMRALLAKS